MHINEEQQKPVRTGYIQVNGLKMYYEVYGSGTPLVLIHGGGSTIETNYGRVIPLFAASRQVIAMELQAHGHTPDRDRPTSFAQDADDIAALLQSLNIEKADFLGFSNGGTTAVQVALRHPAMVNKLILASALTKKNGAAAAFWEFMDQATFADMPPQLKEAFLSIDPSHQNLLRMHDRDLFRMQNFSDIPDEQVKTIQAKTLILTGDQDVATPEHAVELSRLIPGARLMILPYGHGEYLGEITTLKKDKQPYVSVAALIEEFLQE
jgi:pimeloyl-ACP methyl ester carboxylesterase